MGKREYWAKQIEDTINDPVRVRDLLLRNSGLPGRRANLELAAAFADCHAGAINDEWWTTLLSWVELNPIEAPTNNPLEFLPFCATQALGAAFGPAGVGRRELILDVLRRAATDERWRLREAAAFGLQRIGAADRDAMWDVLDELYDAGGMLEWRAVLAALAHPPLLDRETVGRALELAERMLLGLEERYRETGSWTDDSEQWRIIRKGLEFAPSVFVAADPDAGFEYLKRWADSEHIEIKKIVAANLRKARLARYYPEQCEEVGLILSWGIA